MSSITNSPNYDPASTATTLAQAYTAPMQEILTAETKAANDTDTGLSGLNTAMMDFETSLESLTGLNKTMFAQSATFSDSSIGTATADATASAGTYSFFVQQIATASQVSYAGLTDDTGVSGNLVVNLGAKDPVTGLYPSSFTVDTAAADSNGDGVLSVRELAAAINGASGNTSLVSAAVVSTGTTNELILTAKNTGASSAISLDTSALTSGSLKTASANTLVTAQDAIIHVGSETGTAIQQSSNTFTNVSGVKMTFTKAQTSGSTPVTLTVATDTSTTQSNVQAFIDAYNKLKTTLDGMLSPGDSTKNVAPGVFAHDSGVSALRDRLVSLIRPAGTLSLASYGITSSKDGTLTLDATRLSKELAVNPTGLDTLIGSTSASAPSGIANDLDTFLKTWSDSASGQIAARQSANTELEHDLAARQTDLNNQYDAAYQRYLLQFTQLQTLQSQFSSNSSMFAALMPSGA